jgi:hypothetical protein
MKFYCPLTKEKIEDLIENVVFPLTKGRRGEEKLNLELSKLAIIFLLTSKKDNAIFLSKDDKSILQNRENSSLLKEFISLHSNWLQERCNKNEDIELFDDFFEIDSEKVDENINSMHYSDERKISAKEFMEEGLIDEEFISEIMETITYLDELLYQFEDIEIDETFIEKLVSLDSFIKIFEFSIEFRDIGYALENLKEKLILLDINSLNKTQKEILKNFIITIIEDLKKWVDEVVINQTAQDIHYLDASLLANIAQLDIMLDSFKNEESSENSDNEKDDEVEFF